MKFWLAKNSEVPMKEQLVTQITIGVASGDLPTGEKLPSRGEIARRFDIHENTVSNAYRELAAKGLIHFKKGNSFFVCETQSESFETKNDLESLMLDFINKARNLGHSSEEILALFNKHLLAETPDEILLVETDENLRRILVTEIVQNTNTKTNGISFAEFESNIEKFDAVFVALSDEEEKIQSILPPDKNCIYLKARSVPAAMQGETRPAADSLIAIASGWDTFLLMAKTILVAAEVDGGSIIVRSTTDENWQRGLENVSMIICDSLTAQHLPNDEKVRPFPLIAEDSMQNLRDLFADAK